MALYCVGCWNDIGTWTDSQHYVGSAMGTAIGYVFCASCWDGVEDWWMNTAIDEGVWQMCSACSGAATTAGGGTAEVSPLAQVVQLHTGISSSITGT